MPYEIPFTVAAAASSVRRQCRIRSVATGSGSSKVQPLPFSADGDVLGEGSARFEMRAGVLRVVRGPALAAV